jgi:Ca-activated chloride channel family protein
MTFQHPGWLLWLVLLVPFAFLEWRALVRAERSLKSLLGRDPLPGLLVQLRPKRRTLAMVFRFAATVLLAIGAAGPQWGREAVRRQSQGSDVVFVIDVSLSMDTRDVAPSRMEETRREAVALLERLQGSRVGVVAFAGDAVRLCPLTLDQTAVRLTLETLGTRAVSEPGTDLGRALRAGLKLLPPGRRDEQAMVLWTDGEDLEGHTRAALDELRRSGLRTFVVGVGTPAGDVIPLSDVAGVTVDVKRDENGNVVRSRLDENLLRDVARATRGEYFTAARSGGEVVRLARSLGSLARSRKGTRLVERPVARFPLFALVASVCLVALFATPRRRIVKRSLSLARVREARAARARRRSPRAMAAVSVLLLLSLPRASSAQSDWARGNAAFRQKDWAKAESLYVRRARQPKPPPGLLANLATARAHLQRPDSVEQQLARLAAKPDAAGRMSGYNLGTLQGGRGEYDRALAELRRALERDPDDADARWNYEWLQRAKQQAEQKPEPQGGGPQPDPQQPQPQPQPQQQPQPGQGQPQPDQPQGDPADTQSQPAPAPDAPGMQQPMTRQQAERLLGSLGDLERVERQERRRNKAVKEKRGKDW